MARNIDRSIVLIGLMGAGKTSIGRRVAARLAVGKPTVSAAVDALCQRGLLVRADSLGDQRVVALELTPAGEATLGRVEAAMAAQLTAVCGRLTDGDVVIRTFAALGDELDERRAGRSQ